jgi:hypothetical protein
LSALTGANGRWTIDLARQTRQESTLATVPSAKVAETATAAASLEKVTFKTAPGTAPASSAADVVTAKCDAGQHVIAGGVKLDTPGIGVVNDDYPDANGTAWTAHVGNGSTGSSSGPRPSPTGGSATTPSFGSSPPPGPSR